MKVAIIGAGDMGKVHAAAWASRGIEVAAICDVDEKRSSRLAEEVGAQAYPDFHQALERSDIDAISVCVPVSMHADVSCLALDRGKHVLCEKPIALTLADADRMIEASRRNNRFLSISYQYRRFEYVSEIRERFRRGDFGSPIFASFTDIKEVRPKLAMHRRSLNGGPIVDAAGHYFDLMRYITGSEPKSVSARGFVFGAGKKRLAGIDDLAIDAAEIQVTMENDHVLRVFMNWGMPEGYGGVYEFELSGAELHVTMRNDVVQARYRGRTETWSDFASTFHSATGYRVDEMIMAVRDGQPPEVSGTEGRRALAVSLAALESIRRGTEVAVETK